jgi:hypothetical protein
MRFRRPNLFLLGGMLIAAGLATVALMLVHVPAFYSRAAEPEGAARVDASNEFILSELGPLYLTFKDSKGDWNHTLTQNRFNSYFQEHFALHGDAERFRKVGITEPRIEFDEDRIRIGFRYGEGKWSTILSYDLKAWVSSSEPNVIVVEFLRCRAGAMPAPTQQVFQELTELAQQLNIDVDWYRHDTHAVAVVRFQRPNAQISSLKATPGRLTISGISFDPTQTPIEEPLRTPPTPETPATPVSQEKREK